MKPGAGWIDLGSIDYQKTLPVRRSELHNFIQAKRLDHIKTFIVPAIAVLGEHDERWRDEQGGY